MANYKTIDELTTLIDEPNRSCAKRFLSENAELLKVARGSLHNHQAWQGGYLDHITDAMNIAVLLYSPMNDARPMQFSLSDALLGVFLHDAEKPWKYECIDGEWKTRARFSAKIEDQRFRIDKIAEYGFALTPEHYNAIEFAEGEQAKYTNKGRGQLPLAAFVHMCDVASARIWFDCPKEHDAWR